MPRPGEPFRQLLGAVGVEPRLPAGSQSRDNDRMILSWLQRRRRARLLASPIADAWLAILVRNVPYYPLLTPQEQEKLRCDLRVFVAEKRWEGCGGLTVDDEMRVTIAAQACLLTLARELDDWRVVESILIYPSEYEVPVRRRAYEGFGIVGPSERLGESWYRGPVVLSWREVLESSRHLGGGRNLVWHEFAHQLDMLDREIDGTPPLENRAEYRRWSDVMTAEHERLRSSRSNGRADFARPLRQPERSRILRRGDRVLLRSADRNAGPASGAVRAVPDVLPPGHRRATGPHLAGHRPRPAGLQLSHTIREASPPSRRSHSRRTSPSPSTQTSNS